MTAVAVTQAEIIRGIFIAGTRSLVADTIPNEHRAASYPARATRLESAWIDGGGDPTDRSPYLTPQATGSAGSPGSAIVERGRGEIVDREVRAIRASRQPPASSFLMRSRRR